VKSHLAVQTILPKLPPISLETDDRCTQTHEQMDKLTNKQSDRQPETDRQTDGQAYKMTNRWRDRQADGLN